MPKILFIEDDQGTSDVIRLMLRPMGVEVVSQRMVRDILAMVDDVQPDLILMDLRLPEPSLDGLTAAEILKTTTDTSEIPIVILTANGSIEDEQAAFEIGCNGFLRKPIHPSDLRDYLSQYF